MSFVDELLSSTNRFIWLNMDNQILQVPTHIGSLLLLWCCFIYLFICEALLLLMKYLHNQVSQMTFFF